MDNEHGYCPKCNADLDGGSIWQTFYDQAIEGKHYKHEGTPASEDEAKRLADASAKLYGASRTKGKWGRVIGMTDMIKDRIVSWVCPDCKHEWPR